MFEKKELRRLTEAEFQLSTIKEVTRMMMKFIKEEAHYEKVLGELMSYIKFGGVSYTADIFSMNIPIVVETVDTIDLLFLDASGKKYGERREWLRHILLALFLELLDVHKMHKGTAPFKDIWRERYTEKMALAALSKIKSEEEETDIDFIYK